MLTENHKHKLAQASAAHAFETSTLYTTLEEILEEFRTEAIRMLESAPEHELLDSARRLQTVNRLLQHVRVSLASRLALVEEVADELGVDLDNLRLRREIENG